MVGFRQCFSGGTHFDPDLSKVVSQRDGISNINIMPSHSSHKMEVIVKLKDRLFLCVLLLLKTF